MAKSITFKTDSDNRTMIFICDLDFVILCFSVKIDNFIDRH